MYWRYAPYVSVAEKRRRAEKKLKQLRKKDSSLQPIVIDGGAIAKTWWGKAWNTNLERYADYANRIGRGRSYVRHGSVLDMKISRGEIESLVMGSSSSPYSIKIKIGNLPKKKWTEIKKKAKDKIGSLQKLLDGKFPKDLGEIFTAKGEGLFPAPKEIKLSCSCPDWASMCKHVAAVLYGVGVRLDENPGLFFALRGVNIDDLAGFAVEERKSELLKSMSGKKKASRIIKGDDAKLSKLFDIDLAETEERDIKSSPGKKSVRKKNTKRKDTGKLAKKKTEKKKVATRSTQKTDGKSAKKKTGKKPKSTK